MSAPVDLLLIPGLLCTDALYAPLVPALGRHARLVVANHRRQSTMGEIAAQILSEAPAKFALCGLSMGGYIAFEIMRQAPERVSRLALLDTMARADTPERMAGRKTAVAKARAEGMGPVSKMLLPQWVHPSRLSDKDLCATVAKMAADTGVDAFERQQAAIAMRIDSRPTLSTINCPTLVLVGRQDAATPVAEAEEIAAGIKGSTLVVIEDCGHLTTMERPAETGHAVLNWLVGRAV
ncbi:MAG: alpha/beta fold hydrolase [Hyphomicrobiaceae bacterium]